MNKIKLAKITLLSVFIVLGLVLSTKLVHAEVIGGGSLPEYIKNLYNWAITIGGSLATLVLIYAGYLYATSAGNPEQVNLAKEYIIGALSGLAFLLLAAVIYDAIKVDSNTSNTTTTPTPNDNPYQVPPDEIPQEQPV